jgi:predicted outer membrane repeat protein
MFEEVTMRALGIFCLMLMGWSTVRAGGAPEVTVGTDSDCDYSSITAASFNAPASSELIIRVAKNFTLTAPQLLDDRNTRILGGYDSCLDTTQDGRTVLDGSGFNGPLFFPTAATSSIEFLYLDLENLELTGGNSTTGGGVITMTGSWQLNLNNVYAHHNSSNQNGGVISLKESTTPAVLAPWLYAYGNSVLSQNSALNGGALSCDGMGKIIMYNTQLANNSAAEDGGAVYLDNNCVFEQLGGQFLQGVLLNEAGGYGGGVYATNQAVHLMRSNFAGLGVAAVVSNTAANGGGIALENDARLDARDAVINANTALNTGGGVRSNGGHVVIRRMTPGLRCHQEHRCSSVSDNTVTGTDPGFSGGGAIATFGGTLSVTGTYLEGNSAAFGSAIRARFMPFQLGVGPDMKLVGNVVAGNEGAPQVIYLDESSADIAFSTFTDNLGLSRVIELSYPTTSADDHQVTVTGSIFDHAGDTIPGAELTTSGPAVVADCNRHEPASTGELAGAARSTVLLPQFENPLVGDYRLQEGTAFVDWCDASYMGIESDHSANGYARPMDDAGRNNHHGTYDLGGLERYREDGIFATDFD